LSTGTDHNQVSIPFSGTIHDFSLWPSLPLQLLCSWQIAASLLKDILGRGLFCLPHLFTTG
jgi:hypothetical protein